MSLTIYLCLREPLEPPPCTPHFNVGSKRKDPQKRKTLFFSQSENDAMGAKYNFEEGV